MDSRLPIIDAEGEVEDLSTVDPARFKPFTDLPASLQAKLGAIQRGRPKAPVTKERITIRLSPEVIARFRATGSGWQTRMNEALKDWIATHPNP